MKVTFDARSVSAILERRGLGPDRKAEKMLASEIARTTEPYVPKAQGNLANTRRIVTTAAGTELQYIQPYARRQYEFGRSPGDSKTGPLRGRKWFLRSQADHMAQWKKAFGSYIGAKKI